MYPKEVKDIMRFQPSRGTIESVIPFFLIQSIKLIPSLPEHLKKDIPFLPIDTPYIQIKCAEDRHYLTTQPLIQNLNGVKNSFEGQFVYIGSGKPIIKTSFNVITKKHELVSNQKGNYVQLLLTEEYKDFPVVSVLHPELAEFLGIKPNKRYQIVYNIDYWVSAKEI
jgi:hypothetical protein